MVCFQILENLKEAVLKPELLPSSSATSLPIRSNSSLPIKSLNDVGDSFLLCGPRTLCLACHRLS